jgi:NADH-quinone oxidoreductase subunit N
MSQLEFVRYTTVSVTDFIHLLPVISLLVGGIVIIGFELVIKNTQSAQLEQSKRMLSAFFFLISTLLSGMLFYSLNLNLSLFGNSLSISAYTHFSSFILGLIGLGTILIGTSFHTDRQHGGEYYALLIFAVSGMSLMVHANDLMLFFVALELMSLCLYVLISSKQEGPYFVEGSMKYFLLGAFASGFLLMGIALIYGAYGTTNFTEISEAQASLHPALFSLGLIMVSVGLFFKFGLVPFHMYIPDAYQAAPSQITQLMAVGVKVAIFLSGIRLVISVFSHDPMMLHTILYPVVVLSVLLANLMALKQNNVKRMLAYSSIAHAGYLSVGLLALTFPASAVRIDMVSAMVIYIVAYGLGTLGLFALLAAIEQASNNDQLTFDTFKGYAKTQPFLSLLFLVLFISIAGLPISAGFVGKYLVFLTAVKAGEIPMTVIAIIGSMIALTYYFRLPINAFLVEPVSDVKSSQLTFSKWPVGVAVFCAALSVILGMMPQGWIVAASRAVFQSM